MNDTLQWMLTPFYLVWLIAGISLMMVVGILLVPYYIIFGLDK
jgi:hypothetical protein